MYFLFSCLRVVSLLHSKPFMSLSFQIFLLKNLLILQGLLQSSLLPLAGVGRLSADLAMLVEGIKPSLSLTQTRLLTLNSHNIFPKALYC